MRSKKALRWLPTLALGLFAACTGVSTIGSGDDLSPSAAGKNSVSHGGGRGGQSNGSAGTAAIAKAGNASSAGKPSGGGLGGAETDPGDAAGGAPQVEPCSVNTDCVDFGAPCERCSDGSYACDKCYCDEQKCIYTGEVCKSECANDSECASPSISCKMCGDGTKSCPQARCVTGKCQTSFPDCPDNHVCDGLACGTQCKQCETGNCAPDVLLYCGFDGKCEPGIPQCGVGEQCRSPRDCGELPNCISCSATTCAAFECLDGACVLSCPTNPRPECISTAQCPATGACRKCPDGACATTLCLKGSCELICGL